MSQPSPSTRPSSSAADPLAARYLGGQGEQIRKDLLQVQDWCRYRAPNEHQQNLIRIAHDKVLDLMEFLVMNLEPSRERSLALTSLRESRMWVNAAIVFDEAQV